jgi:multicomponent Na+:H+ antiporter subunit E
VGRALALAIMLSAFWAALSFHFSPLLVGFGVVCIVSVTLVCARHDIMIQDWSPLRLVAGLRYLPWLMWQVLLANLRVIRIVCRPTLEIDPRVVEVPCDLETPTGRALYANSITMTPGTVTMAVGEKYIVHALTADDEAGLLDDDMQSRVRALEPRS